MIDHVAIRTRHIAEALQFYDAAIAALGGGVKLDFPKEQNDGRAERIYGRDVLSFGLIEVDANAPDGLPVHLAFSARTHAEVDAFYKAAMAAGGRDNGGPGPRPQYGENCYAAFVFDPDGNNIEAVCFTPE